MFTPALYQLMDKDAVEPVQNLWASPTFLASKTTQPLETYSRSEQTKPFKDHQDHPPIRGVGYLNKFHVKGLTYQFKALPVGLSTTPMEFTVVAKELN